MGSTSDPLNILKQTIRSRTKITYKNASGPCSTLSAATHLVFSPSLSLPKSTRTRLRKATASSKDPQANPGDFYQLDAVYLAWLLRDASTAEYMKQARENGLIAGFVSVTERKGAADWLESRTSHYDRIVPLQSDTTTPPGTPPTQTTTLPTTGQPGAPTSSPTKRRYVVDTTDAEIVKKIKLNEVELSDRNAVLRGAKANNFSSVRLIYADKMKKLKELAKSGSTQAPVVAPKPDPKVQARKARNMFPIIVISSSPTSLITMYNVKRFLQDSVFESPTEARSRAAAEGNARAEDVVAIYRTRTHIDSTGAERQSQARYFVVDSVEALSKFGNDAWDRVVAVLTTGQAWQFKPYKWSDPRTLFHHVKGFYVSWTSDPANNKIKDWNVTELKIDQSKRHIDKSVVASFWKTLDTWTVANKPWLVKS